MHIYYNFHKRPTDFILYFFSRCHVEEKNIENVNNLLCFTSTLGHQTPEAFRYVFLENMRYLPIALIFAA